MMFHIGDRVECVVDNPDKNSLINIGDLGVVCKDNKGTVRIGIRWDNNVGGHSCSGTCTSGHGWYVWPKEIRIIKEDEITEIDENSFLSIALKE